MTLTFDTLEFFKSLKDSGFSQEQSDGVTKALSVIVKKDEDLVTKEHLDMQLNIRVAELKAELLKWMVGLMLGQTAIIVALVKLL